jgi:hypothetical protein
MPYAVITVDKIDKKEAGYIHLKCKAQKAWNCNVDECIEVIAEGERYKIDYAETAPSGGRKYGSKYINRARHWQPEDGPNTWPDKEPYNPNASKGTSGGSSVSKDSYDSETSKRQTCINSAAAFLGNAYSGLGVDLDQFAIEFPVVFEKMYECLAKGVPALAVGVDSGDVAVGDDDIPF